MKTPLNIFSKKIFVSKSILFTVLLLGIDLKQGYSQCGYLNDFVPSSSESIKEVNVAFWKLTYMGSPWAGVDAADAQLALDRANAFYSLVPAPDKTLNLSPPVQYITDNRIRLVLKSFTTIVDGSLFDNDLAAFTGVGSPNGVYRDDNAINVYLVENTNFPNNNLSLIAAVVPTTVVSSMGWPGWGVKHYVHCAQGSSDLISNYGVNLAHEIGHILGLRHANETTIIGFPELACTTCTYSYIYDHALEVPGGPCHTSGYSNNLMNSNNGCEMYHSPQQMGVMHYHLMTQRPNWLTASSYTAVTAVNTAFDYTVTSGTWSTPRFFKGNVIVPAGVTLSVTAQVGMQRGVNL